MALSNCIRITGLQCFQKQLCRATVSGTCITVNTAIQSHWKSVHSSQLREYKRFSRVPLEVIPSKQDEGKILATDYVDSHVEELSDIKAEAARLAALLKESAEIISNEKNQRNTEDSTKEKASKHKRKEKTSSDAGAAEAASDRKPKTSIPENFFEPDPEIRSILKPIQPELFINAPAHFRRLLSKCSSTEMRREHDVVLLESPKLVREAISVGLTPAAVYVSRKKLLLDMMPRHMSLQEKVDRLLTYKIITTPYKKLNLWSSVVKEQGLLAVFRLSEAASAPRLALMEASASQPSDKAAPASALTVVLDGVREPGNMGAIIRTVAAVGAKRLVLVKGCCDPWEGKALRAGCGGHFSLDIVTDVAWEAIYCSLPPCPSVYVADVCNSDREPINHQEQEQLQEREHSTEPYAESEEELRFKLKREQKTEMRRMMRDEAEEEEVITVGNTFMVGEDGNELMLDHSFNDEDHVNEFADVSLPSQTYNDIIFYPPGVRNSASNEEVVLVIGSETGVSNSAKKFACDNLGRQVSIPLQNGIDSLNTSVASGIILYEIWNQALRARQEAEVATALQQN